MKKLFAAILSLLSIFAVVSCKSDKYADLTIANISGFGQNIINKTSFEYKLDEVYDYEFVAKQLKIDMNRINTIDGKAEMFRATYMPEEVLIIGAKDSEAAKEIVNGPLADWVKDLREGFAEYGPDQVPKLDSCVRMAAGRYAFLIISNDNAAAKNALTTLLDTAIKIHE